MCALSVAYRPRKCQLDPILIGPAVEYLRDEFRTIVDLNPLRYTALRTYVADNFDDGFPTTALIDPDRQETPECVDQRQSAQLSAGFRRTRRSEGETGPVPFFRAMALGSAT